MITHRMTEPINAWLCLILSALIGLPAVAQVTLESPEWTVTIDLDSLGMTALTPDGGQFRISQGQGDLGEAGRPKATEDSVSWTLPDQGLSIQAELLNNRLILNFTSNKPGEVVWPLLIGNTIPEAYIMPYYEGVYVPTDDEEWIKHLVDSGPLDTTASLSMPFIGFDLGGKTLTYIFDQMFDNRIDFGNEQGKLCSYVTHTFMDNWDKWEYTVIVHLGDGSPIAPAKAYREYLIERGEFVTMAQKIEANPRAERLLGAPHAYLWDAGVLSHVDVTDWKGFAARLIEEGKAEQDILGKQIWDSFNDEARKSAAEITTEQWPNKYIKGVVATQVSDYLAKQIETGTGDDRRDAVLGAFCEHFSGLVGDYNTWGDGISTKMIDTIRGAGLDRMNLCLAGPSAVDLKPQAAIYADEIGYLFGPYDSYHSVHRPDAAPDDTWETAQFGWELYNTGGVVRADGSMSAGFKKVGYHVSPSAARPYVEKRVNEYMSRVRFSSVFVDCDAFGQFFDDYSPDHPATKQQDMLERLDRMSWLNTQHGLIVGSEGGSGYAAPVIHFAHGMFTPVIGWGDPDYKDKTSPYYLGAYWPPDGPAIFTLQVPLKPKYKKFYYDPAYRLPLYQAAFHDSVVATHHWGNHSLKFKGQVQTVALLEQLYNVPPLYHLNHEEFKKHKNHILAHYAFFSPLHRELALQPMVGFDWLADDRLIQQVTFADGTRIIANFGEQPTTIKGHDLPAQSVIAIRSDAEVTSYTPE